MTTRPGTHRFLAAAVVGSTALGALAALSATAAAAVTMAEAVEIQLDSDSAGITAQGQTTARLGETFRVTGNKWCFGDKKTGQWVGVKIDAGKVVPKDPAVKTPDGKSDATLGPRGVVAMLKASDDPSGTGNCALDAEVALPSVAGSNADAAAFADGTTHQIQLLAGSFGPAKTSGGPAPHGATLGFTVGTAEQAGPASREVAIAAQRTQGVPGQYQGAYSAKTGKYYVTGVVMPSKAADGTLTDNASTIAEYDPATGTVVRAAALPTGPAIKTRGVDDPTGLTMQVMPHGIAIDDARGLIWTTDTRQNTVSAYDLATFAPVWRSADGAVAHGREVMVLDNGTVVASGAGGLYEITGSGKAFSVAKREVFGAGSPEIVVGMTALAGNKIALTQVAGGELLIVDTATWAVVKSPLNAASNAAGVTHGSLSNDRSTGVIVQVDQGANGVSGGPRSGSGVNFFTSAGAPLGRVTVGSQNLSTVVDEAADIAYVGDFGTGEVRAFDLRAAAAGAPVQIGETDVMTTNARGVNHLAIGAKGVLVVGKDKGYAGVTVPYGVTFKDAQPTSYKGDADSLALLKVKESAGTFDPASDIGTSTAAAGYDVSALPVLPKPVVTPPSTTTTPPTSTTTTTSAVPTTTTTAPSTTVPTTTSPSVPTTTPAPAGGSLGDLGLGNVGGAQLGLLAFLGGIGFLGGVLAGLTPFQAQLAPFLAIIGLR